MASLAQLRDAYRADAAELAKFLDQLCLTLQQGKEMQKRLGEAVDRLDAAHKASVEAEAKQETPKQSSDVTEGYRPKSDASADTTDATPLTKTAPEPKETPSPTVPTPCKAPPPCLRTPVKAKPSMPEKSDAKAFASKAHPPSLHTPVKAPPPSLQKNDKNTEKSEKAEKEVAVDDDDAPPPPPPPATSFKAPPPCISKDPKETKETKEKDPESSPPKSPPVKAAPPILLKSAAVVTA